MRVLDLHTDFILGEKKLDKYFQVNTHTQINEELAIRGGVEILLAGFSYDDMNGMSEKMLTATENYSAANPQGKLKIVTHLEGAQVLAKDRTLLHKYYKRGVRSVGLAHIEDNSLCGSSSTGNNLGLSKNGKQIVEKAIKLGMAIDLAHMSSQSFNDSLLLLDGKPPLVSHTACFSIENNPRNNTDTEFKTIGKLGGVVGIFFSGKYLNSRKKATINDVVKHIIKAVRLSGINSVGIGSDFGGITSYTPQGLESAEKLPQLHKLLLNRGFSKKDLEKIFYLNAHRVLSAYIKL